MAWLGLFKHEAIEQTNLCWEARSFLGYCAEGRSDREAARQAGVSDEILRDWKSHKAFRNLIRQARRNGPGLTARGICNLDQLDGTPPVEGAWSHHEPPPLDDTSGVRGPMFGGMGRL